MGLRCHEEPHPILERALSGTRLAELYPLLCTTIPWAVRQACAPKVPTADEVSVNRRSRSSMVHILEKIERTKWISPDQQQQQQVSSGGNLTHLFKRPQSVAPSGPGRPNGLAAMPPKVSGAFMNTFYGKS